MAKENIRNSIQQGIETLIEKFNSRFSELKLPYELGVSDIDINSRDCNVGLGIKDYREKVQTPLVYVEDIKTEDGSVPLQTPVYLTTLRTELYTGNKEYSRRKPINTILQSIEIKLVLSMIGEIFFDKPDEVKRDEFIRYILRVGEGYKKIKDKLKSESKLERINHINREMTGGSLGEYFLPLVVYHNEGLKQLIFNALELVSGIDFGYSSLIEKKTD